MMEVELALKKLDRVFRKSSKFDSRQYLDIENHPRRDARMKERI